MLRIRATLSVLCVILLTAAAGGQETRSIDPREFGLDIPAGTLAPGNNEVVQTADDEGKQTIGRVHVRVGTSAVILLPDGELVGRREGQFTPTDRRFSPLDKDDLVKRLAV